MRNRTAGALLSSPVRRDILRVLASLPAAPADPSQPSRAGGMTAAELGERLGLHITTIRFHVDQMLDADLLVARDIRVGVGRPRRYYSVHPVQLAGAGEPLDYQMVAEILAEACPLSSAAGALTAVEAAARAWAARRVPAVLREGVPGVRPGERPPALDVLTDLLERWGFAPSPHPAEPGSPLELTACPAADLTARHPALMVAIERGLVVGVLTALDADLAVEVRPLERPGTAIIRRVGSVADAAG